MSTDCRMGCDELREGRRAADVLFFGEAQVQSRLARRAGSARHRGRPVGPDPAAGAGKVGFDEIDKKLHGLQRSNLLILAARPGMGKTSLALGLAKNVATGTGELI
ncbi:MAG: hypothetical protein HC788_15830 [Sphingopyxis sp.]|nr:hypothetical protein [Sphingopyxis sp.]